MNITCFNTWKEFFKFKLEELTEEDDKSFQTEFDTAESAYDKWLCAASERHQLVSAKIENNDDPVIQHTFLTVRGDRREIGLKKMRSVILNGMTRNAQAASVNMEELFGTRKVASYPLQSLFTVDSVEEVIELAAKTKTKKNNPQVEISPCVTLPKHIALALLEAEHASTEELFLVAKEAIISKLTSAPLEETLVPGDINIPTQGAEEDLKFSSTTIVAHGGEVLLWILSSLDERMVAADATVPMSGTLIQQGAKDAEYCRLGREDPQSAIHASSNDRASIAESFENLRGILDGANEKFVEKSSGSKVHDKSFLPSSGWPHQPTRKPKAMSLKQACSSGRQKI